jgi:hypothetical protein
MPVSDSLAHPDAFRRPDLLQIPRGQTLFIKSVADVNTVLMH